MIKFAAAYAPAPVLSHAELSECGFQYLLYGKKDSWMFYNFFILLSASNSPAMVLKAVIATVDAIFKEGDGPRVTIKPIFYFLQSAKETRDSKQLYNFHEPGMGLLPIRLRVRCVML